MTRSLRLLFALTALFAFSGCVHHPHRGHHHRDGKTGGVAVHKPGPPPHAPAHGHRHRHHRHQDVDLVFDSGMGVYVVVGMDDVFFHHDHFYRVMEGAWHRSLRVDRGWVVAREDRVPPGLVKKRRNARKHRHKHHPHPAKHSH